MRIRLLSLPQTPYALVVDRLGEDVMAPEVADQIREQTGAAAVIVSAEDVELDAGYAAADDQPLRLDLSGATDNLDDDPRMESM